MIKLFNQRWDRVPLAVLDVETTGIDPWKDAACQVAVVRFEQGKVVDSGDCLINPGKPIPEAATAIHGITDEMVKDAPTIEEWFSLSTTVRLLEGAQPAAYNQGFDRQFVPSWAFADAHWPWLDPLVFVRLLDRFVRGTGRHKLTAACERHGVKLDAAHSAGADAKAAGELFYVVLRKLAESHQDFEWLSSASIGGLLEWQRIQEARAWRSFNEWLSKQPPREVQANG